MARLTGKVALITGAAGGQGTAEAELLVREAASVVVTDIDGGAGEALAQRLKLQGGKALFLPQDVSDEASWNRTLAVNLTGAMLGMKLCARHPRQWRRLDHQHFLDCRAYGP